MKKILSVLLFCLFFSIGIKAEDMLPSDVYYKDNIAVNEINANAPNLRVDDPIGPGGIGGPGGNEDGNGGFVGSAPIGDAVLPISLVALSYGIYLIVKSRRKSKNAIN